MINMISLKLFPITLILCLTFATTAYTCPSICRCTDIAAYCFYKGMTTKELKTISHLIPSYTKKLYLSGNQLHELPLKKLAHLESLQYLSLSFNKLKMAPANLSSYFPKLTELYLTSNRIEDISNLEGYENLLTLNLGQNHIKYLKPFTFQTMKNLKELLLDKNQINSIARQTFYGLSNLEKLKLSDNKMVDIDEMAFETTKNLREIYLHVNSLKAIHGKLFKNLPNLKLLYLYDNKINDIGPGVFENMNLDVLYLNANNITSISSSSFKNIKVNDKIYMHDNPFVCDCQLKMNIDTQIEVKNWIIADKLFLGKCFSQRWSNYTHISSFLSESNNCSVCDLNPCSNLAMCVTSTGDIHNYECISVETTTEVKSTTTPKSTPTSIGELGVPTTILNFDNKIGENKADSKKSDKTYLIITLVCLLLTCTITTLTGWIICKRKKKKAFQVNYEDKGSKKNHRYSNETLLDTTIISTGYSEPEFV